LLPTNVIAPETFDSPAPQSSTSVEEAALSSTLASNNLQDPEPTDSTSTHTPDLEMQQECHGGAGLRSTRPRRLPLRFRDELPVPPPTIEEPPPTVLRRVILYVFDSFRTSLNKFGIGREYRHRPSYDPDAFVSVDQLSNVQSDPPSISERADHSTGSPFPSQLPPWPWKNMSIWRLMSWKMTSTSGLTSEAQVTHLVSEVLKAKDFSVGDLPDNFNTHTEMIRFDTSEATLDPTDIFQIDGWRESAAEILVPTREKNPGGNGQSFTVQGFHHRSLVAVICAAFSEASSRWFHLTPFKRFWKSPVTGREQRVYDELYTSDAWNKAHDELQKQKRDNGCKLEWVIAGLMFWSDATHLTQFGNASAWPIYLFFGNQSKYKRSCPTINACHPIAFIPSVSLHHSHPKISQYPDVLHLQLPESIVSFISKFIKKKSINDILTHCKRELFHALWRILLDDEFVDAYRNGIVIKCHDGVYRRVFPRIFTYSADYPEK
jgi:hypothetical protein